MSLHSVVDAVAVDKVPRVLAAVAVREVPARASMRPEPRKVVREAARAVRRVEPARMAAPEIFMAGAAAVVELAARLDRLADKIRVRAVPVVVRAVDYRRARHLPAGPDVIVKLVK